MYVYIQSEPTLWTVGFYDPSGKWCPESDHDDPDKAADRVAYLNGSPRQTAPDNTADFQQRVSKATGELAEALGGLLETFPEAEGGRARVALANYTLGYLGVHYAITV